MLTGRSVTAVTDLGVEGEDAYGEPFALPCSGVVLVTQRVSDDALYLDLTDDPGEIEGVWRIGDCVAPRVIADAIFDGHRLAREIDTPDPATPLPWLRERTSLG
jgi:dimethylamine/trimethylamine dehydrogenase